MSDHDSNSLRPALTELERWRDGLAPLFFPQRLPPSVITIQSGGRHALGRFVGACWERRDGSIFDEINLYPETLGRDVYDNVATLVHEMGHLANYAEGVKDCCANHYHNEQFRSRAQSVGLICERVGVFGWAKTRLSVALREWVAAKLAPDPTAFEIFRLPPSPRCAVGRGITTSDGIAVEPGTQCLPPQEKLVRWSCRGRCKPVWAPAGSSLLAKCMACGGAFFRC